MINNKKFHQLGTKHKTYVERFEEKYNNIKEFHLFKIDDNNIQILSGQKIIDNFTSNATVNQFLLVLLSFGMIEQDNSNYKIINNKFNVELVFENIFKTSDDEKVNVYRDSRKISLLYLLNLIDNDLIRNNSIYKTRGLLTIDCIEKEISIWEKEMKKDLNLIIDFLERIRDEK